MGFTRQNLCPVMFAALLLFATISETKCQLVTKDILAAAIPVFDNQLMTLTASAKESELLDDLEEFLNLHSVKESESPSVPSDASSFDWGYGLWKCSARHCGESGILHRDAVCQESDTLTVAPPEGCVGIRQNKMPTTGEACRAPACKDVLKWVVSPWSSCIDPCGSNSFQNRTVQCLSADNVVQPNELCLANSKGQSQPTGTRKCDQQEVCNDSEGTSADDDEQVPAADLRINAHSSDESSASKSSSAPASSDSRDSSSGGGYGGNDSSESKSRVPPSSDSSEVSDESDSADSGSSSGGAVNYNARVILSSSGGRCGRCRSGGIGPWYIEKRLWYQIVWWQDKICFKGCYKHEDARSGKTKCTSTSGAPRGGCTRQNIRRCKKWSGCHDLPYDYFIPTCETCKYLGLRRSTVAPSIVVPLHGSCESKVISGNLTCCPARSALDKDGNCCTSGRVDACGNCDGKGKSIDILGQCCEGDLAADGFCCSKKVDECGVCGGMGTTCGLRAEYMLTGNSTADLEQLAYSSMPDALARLYPLWIMPKEVKVQVDDTITAEDGAMSARGRFTMPPLPDDNALDKLEDEAASLGEILSIDYAGTCGNAICEIGEQTRASGEGTCEGDCAFPVMLECQCFGKGLCVPTSGICDCFPGYEGDWCQYCSQNYTQMGDNCVPVFSSGETRPELTPEIPEEAVDILALESWDSNKGMNKAVTVALLVLSVVLAGALGALISVHVSLRKELARTTMERLP